MRLMSCCFTKKRINAGKSAKKKIKFGKENSQCDSITLIHCTFEFILSILKSILIIFFISQYMQIL